MMNNPGVDPFERGTALVGQGDFNAARGFFLQAVAADPKEVAHWLSLIEVHLRLGDVRAAVDAVRQAIRAVGSQPGLVRLCATLEQSLPAPGADAWSVELQSIESCVDQGDFAQAQERAEAFVQRWPDKVGGWSLLAECRHHGRDHAGAVAAARHAVALTPDDPGGHVNLGVMLKADGQLDAAESSLLHAAALDPRSAQAYANLGGVKREQGDTQAAEESYRRAIELSATHPGVEARAHCNLANLLVEIGQRPQAEASFRRALELDPTLAAAANNLGNLLDADGRLEDACAMFERSIAVAPDLADAHANLGNVLRKLKRPEAAVIAYQRALELDAEMTDVWRSLGVTQFECGQLDQAEQSFREGLRLAPDRIDLLEALGVLLGSIDAFEQAAACFEQALALAPDNPGLLSNLAGALQGQGLNARAEEAYRGAIALDPEGWGFRVALAYCLAKQKRFAEAQQVVAEALRKFPDIEPVQRSHARLLMELGEVAESEAAFRKALALDPGAPALRSSMLVAMAFTGHWSGTELRAAAEQWQQAALSAAERAAARNWTFSVAPRASGKRRLGVMSAELGQHPVAYFLLPWLRALDRDKFELYLYPVRNRNEDSVQLFRGLADHWAPLAGLSDACAVDRIRADKIDILIETTGHDRDHRLGVIARRAAPVQCHYIGYYATTGLSEMDYFIADPVLAPPEHDHHFTEQVWRLPRSRYAYEPLEQAPQPRWLPDPDGQLWVGSFNNLVKVREETLALWARVLHALPEARLALKDSKGANAIVQERIFNTLAAHGIPRCRVAFMGQVRSWAEHMDYYNHLDLALDSVPFNSATTAFDALWMGCPLVTLLGDQLAGRQAASLLHGLGRPEWVAATEEDYVRLAVSLARDHEQRRHIRAEQREQMRQGELCDGPGLSRALSVAFDAMYDRRRHSGSP